eukprot:scaffold128518_cov37-Cyclotella_meneghiniana.AAC.4
MHHSILILTVVALLLPSLNERSELMLLILMQFCGSRFELFNGGFKTGIGAVIVAFSRSSSHSATMMNWRSQRTRQPIMTAAVITILLIVFPSIVILVIFSNDTKKQPSSSSSSSYHPSIRRLEEDTNGPIIMNEISLQKQEHQNQQPQLLSPEELKEKHIKQYLGGLYPKVDRQFHPLYLRDTLHPREIDPKWGEVVDGDIPFFW